MTDIQNLLDIMARLRDPESGCPWDREQSFATIAPYTIEEAYEVADAIERGELGEALCDELGDLLLQVVYHAQMAKESGRFQFADVVAAICAKMVRRHPHVFAAEDSAITAEQQTQRWEELKRLERDEDEAPRSLLAGVPTALPALTRAVKLGRRASSVGFDWDAPGPVRDKLDEELAELDEALADGNSEARAAEVGDVLFAVANLCRHLELDPEACLRAANQRFANRFAFIERAVESGDGDWSRYDTEALERLWAEAKRRERERETSDQSQRR